MQNCAGTVFIGTPEKEAAMSQPAIDTPTASDDSVASKPKKRRRLLRGLGWTLTVLLVLMLAVGGFGWYTVQRSFPQTSGSIEVQGLEQAVSVQRDSSGVPTITARSSHDLFFAQGYVHAQDRFWEMDFRRHVTSARLSELFGESQVGTDTFLRTLGWHNVAQQEVHAMPAEVRAYYEAYADGVNAYLAEHKGADISLEYAVLGLQNSDYVPEPWQPADSVAWLKAMAWDLRTNIEDETARALVSQELDAELLNDLYPDYPFDTHPVIVDKDWAVELPDATAARTVQSLLGDDIADLGTQLLQGAVGAVDDLIDSQGEGIGSNSWVVSGQHTTTGSPILSNDPHLGAELPSVWTQVQLRCETISESCPFDVAGFSFSGLPGIVIGHNNHIAWGFTNLTTDVADLYIERIDGDSYWKDGEQHPIITREEVIKVAGGDDVKIEVRSTGHGPIISGLSPDFTQIAEDPRLGLTAGAAEAPAKPDESITSLPGEFAVSLQWTALETTTSGEAIFALNLAQDFDDFRHAASLFDVPAQNLIYADPEGNIGYQAPGRLPIRGAGDGWLPSPGWDSAYDWQGYVPFEDLPSLYNPESGYIVTANNAIVSDDYPYFLSRDWDYGYRAARIVELLEQKIDAGPVSSQDMAALQMDNQMPIAEALQQAYASIEVDDPEVQKALDGLANWNGQNDADSSEAAFANVLWQHLTGLFVGGMGADIQRDSQARFTLVVQQQLGNPDSAWWRNADAGVSSQQEMLVLAAQQAYEELVTLQGANQSKWNWGKLHALPLTHGTFGTSGIAPIEMLFNRGPVPASGGASVVNATGWGLDQGDYATSTVPSMRMVIDVSDWDASTWVNLTGQSGHAFNTHYVDQSDDWAKGVQRPWGYTPEAVATATKHTLTLTPKP